MNYNKVMIGGNLTRDPEMMYTPKGTAICQIGIAVNRTWSGEDGQKKEEVTFVDATAFGKTAETITKYLAKGRGIFVDGRLKLDTWEDKKTSEKKSKLVVIIESFQFLDKGGKPSETAPKASTPANPGASSDSEPIPF